MSSRIEYGVGQKIGECVFIADIPDVIDGSGQRRRMGKFLCKCGNEFICSFDAIKRQTKSCGCLQKETASNRLTTHGNSIGILKKASGYSSWSNMIQRCTKKNNISYKNYGAKGVKVCDRWLKYENFLADMGLKPSLNHSIDRWPNKHGNYEPLNCRWATRKQQMMNKDNVVIVLFRNEAKPLRDLCELFKIPYNQTYNRIFRDRYSLYKAISRGVINRVYSHRRCSRIKTPLN
jgi:hypothetical protein